ncbi:MAG: hypothetical protein ACTMIR_13605, partial [Cellulomonadaceae bacterium]
AWALTEPVNITPRSTYHRQIPARDRRIQIPTTPWIVMSHQTLNQNGDIRQRARITLIGWRRDVGAQAAAPGAESGEKAIKRGESR